MTPAEGASKFIARQIKIGMPQVYELLRFCRWDTRLSALSHLLCVWLTVVLNDGGFLEGMFSWFVF